MKTTHTCFESHENRQSAAHKMRSLLQATLEVDAESGKLGFLCRCGAKKKKSRHRTDLAAAIETIITERLQQYHR